MADVDVFVGNNILIDPDVYQLWLDGHTAHEAASILQKRGILQQYGATFEMLLSDTWDHYRTFSMLERMLHHPPKMAEQLTFQINPEVKKMLIEKYYEFDSAVVREILGKKLSSRNRNSLDDVSEKTKVPLRSCRRQFDNVKRVFKTVEELMGSLVDNIKSHFLLSHNLATQYAAIVFITNNRFETGKKKLSYLTFADFVHCANEMITHWSYSSKDCKGHEDMDVDFDRDFLYGLRDLKVLADRDQLDEHKQLLTQSVQGRISQGAMTDIDNNFKNLSKNLMNIAYNLNHSKDLRDLFLDLVEKFIEPCKHAGWTVRDVQIFLATYSDTGQQLDFFIKNSASLKVWDRYMTTTASCLQQMYHN